MCSECGQWWEILSSAQMKCRIEKSSLTTTPGVLDILNSIREDFCLQIVWSLHLQDLKSSTSTANGKRSLPPTAQVSTKLSVAEISVESLGLSTWMGLHLQTLYHSFSFSKYSTYFPNSAAVGLSKIHTKLVGIHGRISMKGYFNQKLPIRNLQTILQIHINDKTPLKKKKSKTTKNEKLQELHL